MRVLTAADLLKTTGILKATPDETLARVLPNLARSHYLKFVFNEAGGFLGVINPYYVLFKKHFPAETKLEHCLFHPPKLTPTTPYYEIARKMRESRLYFLPVFEGDQFVGIVTVRRLFDALAKEKELLKGLTIPVKREVMTIHKNATADDAYNLLREKKVSRLVVVDDVGHEVGLVTHYGLQLALNKPKESPAPFSRTGNKKKYLDQPLSKYYKNMVVSAPPSITPERLFERMLTEDTSCILVLDPQRKPVGIVSTSDVLDALVAAYMGAEKPRIVVDIDRDFAFTSELTQLFTQLVESMHTQKKKIVGSHLHMQQSNVQGKRQVYEMTVTISFDHGNSLTAKGDGFEWKNTLHEVAKKIERQME